MTANRPNPYTEMRLTKKERREKAVALHNANYVARSFVSDQEAMLARLKANAATEELPEEKV